MQLTTFTDYSLRVLIYLGTHTDSIVTITDIANGFGISRNHIIKIIYNLSRQGLIQTVRGRHGGILLAQSPSHINLANIILQTEPNFNLVECFRPDGKCCISPACMLRGVLYEAYYSFFRTLGNYTLADILKNKGELEPLFNSENISFRASRHIQ